MMQATPRRLNFRCLGGWPADRADMKGSEGSMVEVGSPAPEFSLPDGEGNLVTLSALRGKKVVLYFYPKDATPGCTQEACDFRDRHAEIRETGAVVLGVSPDD